jgi:predicted DNA-binding protein
MVRFNVNLSDNVHRRFKAICALDGKDMAEVVRRLIEEYVEKGEKGLKLKK